MMNNRDNLIGILGVMYRWRKAIRNVCLLTLVGSIVATLLLPNYYESTTSFYPANPSVANPDMLFGYGGAELELFGGDHELDRMAEIANSTKLVDYMVQKFGLYAHYEIDSTSKEGRFWVRETFRGNYSALKNKNDALEVSVEDQDPDMAAQMANAVREYVNKVCQQLTKDEQAKMLLAFDMNMKRKNGDLQNLADSMQQRQLKFNIYNPGTQSERLSYLLNKAESDIVRNKARMEVLKNNPLIPQDTVEFIKAELLAAQREREMLLSSTSPTGSLTLKGYTEGSPEINVLTDLHFQARKQLSYDLERYNQLLAAFNSDIPMLHTIQVAEPSLMKSRPKRMIIVGAALIAAFFFTVLGVLLLEAYRNVNWKEVFSENP
ncbi:MAG: hypothetical protein IT269_13355 [Saprospiraceae bacterium]|nr:hypothetical protein [Saprospiraceae bacterium]